jgi:hypothetical protein
MDAVQIFLLINALLIGVVGTLAVQYWIAHRRGVKQPTAQKPSAPAIPAATRERLVKQAEENFQGIVNRSALQLQRDLGTTGTQLNKLLEKFGSEVLDDEMKLFRENVASIRASTQGALSGAQDEIGKQQAAILTSLASRQADLDAKLSARQTELEAELETSLASEKMKLNEHLQQKLNDAVLAFLLESLGHDIDLGAQTDYLLKTLEDNKQQLINGVIK